jgi:hypothetical protein
MTDETTTDETTTADAIAESYTKIAEENQRLRDELGRFRESREETPEEQRQRWGKELGALLDSAGGRPVRI